MVKHFPLESLEEHYTKADEDNEWALHKQRREAEQSLATLDRTFVIWRLTAAITSAPAPAPNTSQYHASLDKDMALSDEPAGLTDLTDMAEITLALRGGDIDAQTFVLLAAAAGLSSHAIGITLIASGFSRKQTIASIRDAAAAATREAADAGRMQRVYESFGIKRSRQ
jgi:hypothetical protein